jgi:NSS family neurotransmitter:Na+ symporter
MGSLPKSTSATLQAALAERSQRFSSRWGLILSVLGIAVGTGNIWRFPRIAAQNAGAGGAGAFLVAWVVFLVVWSLPLIIAEYALGRSARRGVIGTFIALGGEKRAWLGGFVALTATAIMFYYSVVAGWCVYYLVDTASSELPASTAAATSTWESFQSSRLPLLFHALAMGIGVFAVRRGVHSIERINRILVPALLAIVVLCLVRALSLDGAGAGVSYLFAPQWSQLAEPTVWLEALTQNAWDTGAGWGLILTYGAYMSQRGSVVKNALITGILNNAVSLTAALIVFGTVFAILGQQMSRPDVLEVMRDSGPASTGLTFIWMPQLFARMPLGRPLAVLFFLALSFAALSSLISMIELATRTLVDMGVARTRAATIVFGVGLALGLPSAIWLDLLGNQDFVWGVALMLSGLFVALLTAAAGTRRFREEFAANPDDWDPGAAWEVVIRFVVPALAVVLLGWWLYLSATAYAPDTWWDPFEPFSVMSCLAQWGLAIAVLVALQKRIVARHIQSP